MHVHKDGTLVINGGFHELESLMIDAKTRPIACDKQWELDIKARLEKRPRPLAHCQVESTLARPPTRQRGSMINPSITAPEITRTAVNLAASTSCCPKASRHNKEFAANASIATIVSNTDFAKSNPEFSDGMVTTCCKATGLVAS